MLRTEPQAKNNVFADIARVMTDTMLSKNLIMESTRKFLEGKLKNSVPMSKCLTIKEKSLYIPFH